MMPLKDLDGRIPFRRRRGLPTGRGAWSRGARETGATVPTGQTEFQFKAGALNFKSAAYEWLVVSGSRAPYKGQGTINGAGDYGFLLTAIDGQLNGQGGTERFRIKIWERGTGIVVYDNALGAAEDADAATALGAGNIVIQKN